MGLSQKVLLNASLLALGRIINALLSVVGVGLTTRYLGIDGYGTLITAIAFVSILTSVTDLGLWTIGSRELAKRPDEEAGHLIGVLIATGLALTVFATAVGYGAMLLIYHDGLQREAIALLLLQLPLSAPVAAVGAYFIARQRAYVGMIASTTAALLMLGILVVVITLDLGFKAVVLAYLANAVGFSVVMVIFSVGRVRLRPAFDVGLSRKLLGWALPLGGFLFTTSLYAKLDILLLSWLSTKGEVALYGLAFKVIETLVVLPSYVTVTLLPEFARLTENRERMDQIVQKAFTVMEVAVVPVVALVLALAPQISQVLGGSAFENAGTVLRLLIPGVGLIYISSVMGQGLIALNRQGALFRTSLWGLAVNAGLNLALIPPLGANGAAIAFFAAEIVALSLVMRAYVQVARGPRLYRPMSLLASGAAMAAAAWGAAILASSAGYALVLGGVLGGLVYVLCMYGLKAMPEEVDAVVVRPVLSKFGHSADQAV